MKINVKKWLYLICLITMVIKVWGWGGTDPRLQKSSPWNSICWISAFDYFVDLIHCREISRSE